MTLPNPVSLFHHRHLLWTFVNRDLRVRYQGSMMGIVWAIVTPILMLVLFTFVFSVVMKVRWGAGGGVTDFAFYLFCGFLPWVAFQEALIRSTTSVVDHGMLIKNVRFPAQILPLFLTLSSVVNEIIGLLILTAAILIRDQRLTWFLLLLPFIFLFQVAFTVGFGWILSTLYVFFRDIIHVVSLGLTVWMFLTPILYPEDLVPPQFRLLIRYNPWAHLVKIYRSIFLDRQWPEGGGALFFMASAVGVFLIGYFVFSRFQQKFSDVI